MTTQNGIEREQAIPPQAPDEQSRNFRLRAEHPRVTRLSRKVLAGGSAVALLVIGGTVLWSLQNNRSRDQAADELYSTRPSQYCRRHHGAAEGLHRCSTPSHPAAWSATPWRPWTADPCCSGPVADDRHYGSRSRNSSAATRRSKQPE